MFKAIDPDDIHEPISEIYHHGLEIPAGARLLFVSGQVGMAKDGSKRDGIEAQSEQLWTNITAILHDAGMTVENIVKINTYIVGMENFPAFSEVRKRFLNGHRPAALGVSVAGLWDGYLVEMDLIAAAV